MVKFLGQTIELNCDKHQKKKINKTNRNLYTILVGLQYQSQTMANHMVHSIVNLRNPKEVYHYRMLQILFLYVDTLPRYLEQLISLIEKSRTAMLLVIFPRTFAEAILCIFSNDSLRCLFSIIQIHGIGCQLYY